MPFMAELAGSYNVIVPDHPGFGRSGRPDWLDEISDLAYFYLDFMQALGLEQVHLVGHSLGGWIAAELAIRSTQHLRTLTLVAAAGIHVNGLPKGDLFLWQPEERIRNLYVDQRFAEKRLAQPMSGSFVRAPMIGRMIVPSRSMCAKGFRVRRPSSLAVWSPRRDAIQACAASWKLRDSTMATR